MGDADAPARPSNWDNALTYIYKVQERFKHSHPEIYEQFLAALKEYYEAPRNIEGVHNKIKSLFIDEPDLLEGFEKFLPGVMPKKSDPEESETQKEDNVAV